MLEETPCPDVIYTTYGGIVDISTRKKDPVYDGDTVTVLRDMGHSIFFKTRFRLIGIDTPEKTGSEKEWGKISRQHLIDLLAETTLWWKFTSPWGELKVPGLVMRSKQPDKYGGRWLGEIWRPGDKRQLQLQMLEDGFARAYDGGKKEPYPLETLPIQPEED